MRSLTFLTILFSFLSCQGNNKNDKTHDLDYSVDTVIIDSQGHLLDLKRDIEVSDLSNDEKEIFLFNSFNHSIDVINLDQLKLVNNIPFGAEGPNGTGNHINFIHLLNDGTFFIKAFSRSAIFKKDGTLLKKIDWVNSFDSNGLNYGQLPTNELAVDSKDLKVFGLGYNNINREVFLDVLSVKDSTTKRFDIDPAKSYQNFILAIDNPPMFLDPYVHLTSENNLIIISHEFSNEMILFSPEGEFVQVVNYEPKMTPKRVKDLESISTTREQLGKRYQHFLEQVRFGPPVWDNVNKRYLRLSAQRVFSDTREEHSFVPDTKKTTIYLTVFDSQFNLTSELAIQELNSHFVKYFVKDGKLWVFKNFSDELGFIVIDI